MSKPMDSHIQTKWTPGPWRYATKGNIGNMIEAQSGRKTYEGDDGWRAICTVQDCCASTKYIEQQTNQAANIALISAAPELAETLAWLLGLVENPSAHEYDDQMILARGAARAALRKAGMRDPSQRTIEPPPCERSYAHGHGDTLHPRFPSGDCVICGALCTEGCKHELFQAWEEDQTS